VRVDELHGEGLVPVHVHHGPERARTNAAVVTIVTETDAIEQLRLH
jgi:hypothetical protein